MVESYGRTHNGEPGIRCWCGETHRPAECDHCKDDPPAGHTCPRCGRASTRKTDAYTARRMGTAVIPDRQD